jgi:hypothetical protein
VKRRRFNSLGELKASLQSTLSARLIARLPECCAFDEWTGANDDLLFRQVLHAQCVGESPSVNRHATEFVRPTIQSTECLIGLWAEATATTKRWY